MADPFQKYLEECGTACPYCDAVAVRRFLGCIVVVQPPDERTLLVMPCRCRECDGCWKETFRLESAAWLSGGEVPL
jgi:hypothetical protein